uniref:L1 transposable element RRM domain-containing protein n=1 Tax=Oryctolagus cuniculus TaxID=9986 RepID=U3KMS4_RABIT
MKDTPIQDYEDDEIEEMQEADLKKLIRTLRSSQKQILELQKSLMDKIENLSRENEILRRNQNETQKLVEQETVIVTRNHNEVKNSIDQMKNTIESLTNRMGEAEERISDLEDREQERIQSDQRKEEIRSLKHIVWNLQDTIKKTNIRVLGVPEGMEREKGLEGLFSEILAENFPGLEKDRDILEQEAHRTPNKHDPKRSSPQHVVIKLSTVKHKEKILKCAREKRQITLRGSPIRLTADFSSETLQARREWRDIAQVLREKNCQPRILYPAKLSFVNEGEIKTFHSKQKLKDVREWDSLASCAPPDMYKHKKFSAGLFPPCPLLTARSCFDFKHPVIACFPHLLLLNW